MRHPSVFSVLLPHQKIFTIKDVEFSTVFSYNFEGYGASDAFFCAPEDWRIFF
jgi:hypothetical protein